MDHRFVEKLEHDLEHAIAEVLQRVDPRKLPHKPSPRTLHLMAKAAATVYEAVAESTEEERD